MPLPPRKRSNAALIFTYAIFGVFFGDLAWFYFGPCAVLPADYENRAGCMLGKFLQQDFLLSFRNGTEFTLNHRFWFLGGFFALTATLTFFFWQGAKKLARANLECVAPYLTQAQWDYGRGWEKVTGTYRGRSISCYAGSGYEAQPTRRNKVAINTYLLISTDVAADLEGVSFKLSGWYVPQDIYRSHNMMFYMEPLMPHIGEYLSGRSTLTPEMAKDRLDHLCDVCDRLRDGKLPL